MNADWSLPVYVPVRPLTILLLIIQINNNYLVVHLRKETEIPSHIYAVPQRGRTELKLLHFALL